jgi:energy-coupling factor transporter transmembrane protein EcfT
MVASYLWPGLAVALIASTRNWRRLIPTAVVAVAVTFGSQSSWRSLWGWWGFMVAGLALTLFFAGVARRRTPAAPPGATARASTAPGTDLVVSEVPDGPAR